MSDAQQRREDRNARFSDAPVDGASQCSVFDEIAIFPVRYAIDESPAQAGGESPHPIPDTWNWLSYPALKTRHYTLRQLRDGWLYVWDESDERLDEYRLEGHQFTPVALPDGDGMADEREADGEPRPYLLYPRGHRLQLTYSPVQWTARTLQAKREGHLAWPQPVRTLDPESARVDCLWHQGNASRPLPLDAGPLTALGQYVADITPDGAVDGFASTTVTTQPPEEPEEAMRYPFLTDKPELRENTIIGAVPDRRHAIFVALDDPLGIVNDLTLHLTGRVTEWEAFDDERGHKLRVAEAVERLCGAGDSELPEDMDPATRREALRLLHQRHDAERQRGLEELNHAYARGLPGYQANDFQARADALAEDLAALGVDDATRESLDAWDARARWRGVVDFDGAVAYVREHMPTLERLMAHVADSRDDLITWLRRLPPSALVHGFDPCHDDQLHALLELAGLVVTPLCTTEEGQAWFNAELRDGVSLLGLSLSGFDGGVDKALSAVAHNFLTTGTPDGQEETLDPGDILPLVSLAAATQGVLELNSVPNSRPFQRLMTETGALAKEVLEALQRVAGGTAKEVWEGLAFQALPALGRGGESAKATAYALKYTVTVGAVHGDAQDKRLIQNGGFDAEHSDWQRRMLALERRIESTQRLLTLGRATPVELQQLANVQRERDALALEQPKRFTGSGDPQLATAGVAKLQEHQWLRADRVGAGPRYVRHWFQHSPGALALLLAGLNVANVANTLAAIRRDGADGDDWLKLSSQVGYASTALMALWVMPFWNRATARLQGNAAATTIASRGVRMWEHQGRYAASRLAGKLASRVAGMAAFGSIGAGVETLEIYRVTDRAQNNTERRALLVKGTATFGMTLVGGAQLFGALAGRLSTASFAWVMGPWAAWAILIGSAAYLISSWIADYYHRDNFRQWLHQSSWGRAKRWQEDNDEHRAEEWRQLMALLLQPSLRVTPAVTGDPVAAGPSPILRSRLLGAATHANRGYWIQLALPAALSGERVRISLPAGRGGWVSAASFAEQPGEAALRSPPAYTSGDTLRVWQAWLPLTEQPSNEAFELSVDYADTSLAAPGELRTLYRFETPQAGSGRHIIEAEVVRSRDRYGLELSVPLPTQPS